MACSLIEHKRINTTVAKARELRKYLEPLMTKSKNDTTNSRRVVFSYLKSKEAINELFRNISVKIASRPGGYTRIIKTGTRLGDNAQMCMMELVDYNDIYTAKDVKTKTTRRSRGKSKSDKEPKQEANKKDVDIVNTMEVEASDKSVVDDKNNIENNKEDDK
ncbi:50S ribosomal protein L17 [Ichthyobacterium seriolicida]|uniref:50S ribosomal protein L17 n=2 Tax=Ichthyobacterium seriolicida TaxID=242600 RepID=A0A1J1EA78_9FLAO|nr:50S ribosomal protein L17 [Ichthyobacterium seriolicida]